MEPRLSFSIWTRRDLPGREVFLADEFIERARPHALGERLVGGGNVGLSGLGKMRERFTVILEAAARNFVGGSFVEKNGCRGRGVKRFDSASHGNADARVSTALDFFGRPAPSFADEQCHQVRTNPLPRGRSGCSPSRGSCTLEASVRIPAT